ncbi:MAG: class C sortase [Ruminococcus sp.]|nr:class C sortase [Ruminococcus sp.]
MKNKISTIFIFIILLAGLSLLLYPTISDYLNNLNQSKEISRYASEVAELSTDDYKSIINSAIEYNKKLASGPTHWNLTDEEVSEYEQELNIAGTGVMAYVDIPKISCTLPIYHGIDEGVLQVAIGHLQGSSLPVGGKSTHCVISGHRGLSSAKLFTDIDKLEIGDTFLIRVLDETLTYEVDQIRIVNPDDTDNILIEDGKDLCTLVTCTPYGLNTHRLLVRGHRIENNSKSSVVRVTADAMQIEPVMVAPVIAVPLLILIFVVIIIFRVKHKNESVNDF